MIREIQEILARHGQSVTIRGADGDRAARAFLQPVAERREQETGGMTGIGSLDGRLWLYLGRCAVETGDRILWNGMELRVRSSRPYYAGEKLLYWWAALERAREAV